MCPAAAAHLANPRVDTAERVLISCDDASGCASWPDASPVVLSLAEGSCSEIAAGSAAVAGRIRTTLDCSTGPCITVPLGGWRDVQGATLAEGSCSVHAFVDLDDDGLVDTGELEACEEGWPCRPALARANQGGVARGAGWVAKAWRSTLQFHSMSETPRRGPPPGIGDARPVQAGCGAIIGALIGVGEIGVIGWGRGSAVGLAVAIGIPAVIVALLAWQYGDRFWETYFGGD